MDASQQYGGCHEVAAMIALRQPILAVYVLGRTPLGVQILYTCPTPKMGIKQIEQFCEIILRILRFLRSRLESQSWNAFNSFPILNEVSTGVPTPPDSGKTPQLRTSKLAQNCGRTEILHLQPDIRLCEFLQERSYPLQTKTAG